MTWFLNICTYVLMKLTSIDIHLLTIFNFYILHIIIHMIICECIFIYSWCVWHFEHRTKRDNSALSWHITARPGSNSEMKLGCQNIVRDTRLFCFVLTRDYCTNQINDSIYLDCGKNSKSVNNTSIISKMMIEYPPPPKHTRNTFAPVNVNETISHSSIYTDNFVWSKLRIEERNGCDPCASNDQNSLNLRERERERESSDLVPHHWVLIVVRSKVTWGA